MDDETRHASVIRLIDDLRDFYGKNDIYWVYSQEELFKFIETQEYGILNNLVDEEYRCPNGAIVPKGMKFLRALKYFIKDKDVLTQIQDRINLIISKNKLSGYLHFSVDPLDYLSISENGYGWRSCHSLDGEYAAGNLEYMMDRATIVCYIDDNTQNKKICNFPEDVLWNSKKWRMLLFVSDDGATIFAGRQYPSALQYVVLRYIRNCFIKFFPQNVYSEDWENIYIRAWGQDLNRAYPNFLPQARHIVSHQTGCIYPLNTIYRHHHETLPLFYDDILSSTVYKNPYFLLGYNKKHWLDSRADHPVITGAGAITCACCGEAIVQAGTDGLFCVNCMNTSDSMVCECCGRRFPNSDYGWWLLDESWWCEDCVMEHAVTCQCCGGKCNEEDAYYDEEDECYYCRNCWEER